MVLVAIGIIGGLLCYGSVSLINGTANLLGMGEHVPIHVTHEYNGVTRNNSYDFGGEYMWQGEKHRIDLESGPVGATVDAQFGPIRWLDFADEPDVSWRGPVERIVGGLFCLGIVFGPFIWIGLRGRRSADATDTPDGA